MWRHLRRRTGLLCQSFFKKRGDTFYIGGTRSSSVVRRVFLFTGKIPTRRVLNIPEINRVGLS
nr:MAG TPA: hypothetical protein [Caudoviricetes sp.]